MNSSSCKCIDCPNDCCPCCPCDHGYNINNDPELKDVEAYITDTPADFTAIGDITVYLREVGDLYIYLLREEPKLFDLDKATKRLNNIKEQYNKFMSSFTYFAYGYSLDVKLLLDAWQVYIKKCSKLLLLRTDSRTKDSLFPIAVVDNSIFGIF